MLFGLRNAVFVEQLPSFQREYVKAAEERRLHMTDSEQKLLQKRVKSILNAEELKDSSNAEEEIDEEDLRGQVIASREPRKTDAKDKVQFKRKKAKVIFLYNVSLFLVFLSLLHTCCSYVFPVATVEKGFILIIFTDL